MSQIEVASSTSSLLLTGQSYESQPSRMFLRSGTASICQWTLKLVTIRTVHRQSREQENFKPPTSDWTLNIAGLLKDAWINKAEDGYHCLIKSANMTWSEHFTPAGRRSVKNSNIYSLGPRSMVALNSWSSQVARSRDLPSRSRDPPQPCNSVKIHM